MARAIIKLIPNREQLAAFNYSDYVAAWDYLAATFTGKAVACDVAESDIGLGLWIDGICIPYDWCKVTRLTAEEAQLVSSFKAASRLHNYNEEGRNAHLRDDSVLRPWGAK